MKIPISEQIEALDHFLGLGSLGPHVDDDDRAALVAALKWVERHQAELRVLAEFPGASVVRRDEE
jgi:hypothetical protein